MSDAISPILQWLNTHPQMAGLATFIISAAESIAIIGTIVPGSIMMTAIGTLAGAGVIPFWETLIWAILGAIVGDGVSYWLGYHFKDRLVLIWPFRKYPTMLRTGEAFFRRFGGMSVFIGRFVGPVRALVPLVAGMLGMKPWKFLLANITSAIGWAPAYMLPGILLGAASLELPPGIAIHIILIVFLFILFSLLCLWFIYKSLQLIHSQTNQLQNEIWKKLQNSRLLSPATYLLRHYDAKQTHGQLHLAIYFMVVSLFFFSLCFYVKWQTPGQLILNQALFHLFRGIHHLSIDSFMINITLLGQKEILFGTIVILTIMLTMLKRFRMAVHLLILVIVSAASIFVFKHLLKIPRPWGLEGNPLSFSMPSGHATLAACFYCSIAFFIGHTLAQRNRKYAYWIAVLIAFFVGLSRLYLGAHWLTDVIAGWLLGTAILLIVIISYHRQYEPPLSLFKLLAAFFASLIISFGVYHYLRFDRLLIQYKPLPWPIVEVHRNLWWETRNVIPSNQVSLFGFPTQPINIEWEGELATIKKTLMEQGWKTPPSRDWISTLHRIADVSSTEYLPMISPQYLDQRPVLTLTRETPQIQSLLVIRLWNSHRLIKNGKPEILWVGTVGTIPRPYSWIFKSHPDELTIRSDIIFPKMEPTLWEWKIITREIESNRKYRHVLLIRRKL